MNRKRTIPSDDESFCTVEREALSHIRANETSGGQCDADQLAFSILNSGDCTNTGEFDCVFN